MFDTIHYVAGFFLCVSCARQPRKFEMTKVTSSGGRAFHAKATERNETEEEANRKNGNSRHRVNPLQTFVLKATDLCNTKFLSVLL